MGHKTGMTLQPALNGGVFARAVVVDYKVEFLFFWELVIKAFQELEEFLVTVAGIALPGHFPLCHFVSGQKERSCRSACSRESWSRSGLCYR
jgi:hypothetical protein